MTDDIRNDIKTAVKHRYGDMTSEDGIRDFVTNSLSPIAILEFYNTASRTINRLKRLHVKVNMLSRVTEVIFNSITEYISLILDVVMVMNSHDYPTTQLPGAVPLPSNTALLDTV